MTTNAINCEAFSDRLMAYLEHEVDDATHVSLERHALTCDDCGALLADLRKLRVDAANLPELTPSRDLWAGIAARIETPVVSIDRTSGGVTRSRALPRWVSFAAVAASLVAAAGVGYFAANTGRVDRPVDQMASRNDSAGHRVVVTAPDSTRTPDVSVAPSQPPAPTVVNPAPRTENPTVGAQLAVATLMADYNREVVRLRRLIEERRNQLDPVTVAIIEKNLQVIDTAIADSQRAIERDPSSRFLIESLNHSLQTKVELMRTAALLPSRT